MFNLKRIAAIFSSCAVLLTAFGAFPGPAAAAEEAAAVDADASTREAALLTELGILKEYSPNAAVSKQMLENSLAAVIGSDSERYFDPSTGSDVLTWELLLPVLVDLSGYTPRTIRYAGSGDRFTRAAREAGILDGIDTAAPLTMQTYVKALYNALTIDMLQAVSFGEETQYTVREGETVLTVYQNISRIQGILRDNGRTALNGESTVSKGNIKIESEVYESAVPSALEYLGYFVEAFVKKDGGRGTVLALAPDARKNRTVALTHRDLDYRGDCTAETFVYSKNGKRQQIRLSPYVDVVYNNRALADFMVDDLLIEEGELLFVDASRDGLYETVIVKEYTSFVLAGVSAYSSRIIDGENQSYDCADLLSGDAGDIRDKNGAVIGFETLLSGNTVSVLLDRDSRSVNSIVKGRDDISGQIEQVNGSEHTLVLNGETFFESPSFLARPGRTEPKAGAEITLKLDFLGEVCDIEAYNFGTEFGYLVGIAAQGQLSARADVKLFTRLGKMVVLSTADKVKLDGVRVSGSAVAEPKNNALFSGGTVKPQLVCYRQNDEGELIELTSAKDDHAFGGYCEDDTFTLNYDYSRESMLMLVKGGLNVLAGKYQLTPSTVIFGIPVDHSSDKDYNILTIAQLAANTELQIRLYNVNEDYEVGMAVLQEVEDTANWVMRTNSTITVEYVGETVNEDGEKIYLIVGLRDGKEYTGVTASENIRYVGSAPDPNPPPDAKTDKIPYHNVYVRDLKPGSVIQVTGNRKSEIVNLVVYHMPEESGEVKAYEYASQTSASYQGATEKLLNAEAVATFGKVVRTTENGVIVNNKKGTDKGDFLDPRWNRSIVYGGTTQIYVFSEKLQKPLLGTAGDIEAGDEIFVHLVNGVARAVVVYKEV